MMIDENTAKYERWHELLFHSFKKNILPDSSRNRSVHKMKNKTTCHIKRNPRERQRRARDVQHKTDDKEKHEDKAR